VKLKIRGVKGKKLYPISFQTSEQLFSHTYSHLANKTLALVIMIAFPVIFYIIILLQTSNCEVFSAIVELEKLADFEKLKLEDLKVFAAEIEDEYLNL
jgi:hypothetical protein